MVAGALKTAGLIEYPSQGAIMLTPTGQAAAAAMPAEETKRRLESVLSGAQMKILDLLHRNGGTLSRASLIEAAGYSSTASTHRVVIGGLKTLECVQYPERGQVALPPWVEQVLCQ